MNADDFCDERLCFLFQRYLSDYYETAVERELVQNSVWRINLTEDNPVYYYGGLWYFQKL